ncbi:hypothetical protein 9g_00026 [Enterobacteria phage 9g]|uniref:Uncharacterized protein n=1 Tax=Enterobacteria phage 9g TaxID=1468411 RepID=X2KPB2_9CAUD|nr:hypothetical protein FH31_gp26 [Enterobacteria phage 9g]AHN84542.1 hypothetical protein 9g_00026 [Enterobacteria phage 9g]
MLELFPQEIKQYEQWAVCGFHPGTSSEKQPYVWDDDLGDMSHFVKTAMIRNRLTCIYLCLLKMLNAAFVIITRLAITCV